MGKHLLKSLQSLLLGLFLILAFASWNTALSQATVSTDKDDYAPGDYVIIKGAGWHPGERINFHFDETPSPPAGYSSQDYHTNADANGNIYHDQFLIKTSHIGVAFVLTATGQTSGKTAITEFTDANVTFSASGLPSGHITQIIVNWSVTGGTPLPNPTSGIYLFNYPGPSSLAIPVRTDQTITYSFSDINISGTIYSAPGGSASGANNNGGAQVINAAYSPPPCTAPSIVTAPTARTITYGDADPTYSITASGDGLSYQWQYNTTAAPGTWVNVGTNSSSYTVPSPTVSFSGRTYRVVVTGSCGSVTSNPVALTVNQKAASVTPNPASKTYGDDDPVLSGTLNGFLVGDNVTATYSRTSGETVAGSPYTISAILSPTGVLGNYSITYNTADFTINKRALTITADDKNKIYGEPNPTLTFSYAGLMNGDTKVSTEPSISTTATQGSPVGTYPITLTGGSDANYEITFVNGTLTVSKKTLTITADDKNKVYGAVNPSLTFSYSGLVNGDTKISVEPSVSTTATQSSPVGTYPINLTGGSDPNYEFTLVAGTLTIGKSLLTIIADDKNKEFGDPNPALTFSYSGLVNGDTKISVEPEISTTATTTSGLGNYPINLTGGSDPNYEIVLTPGTLTIGKKKLTITADNKNKAYGDPNPILTISYSGLVNGDTKISVEPNISTTATQSSPVGTYPITLTGGSDPNYEITLVDGTLTVSKKTLTITADDKTKVYGDPNPALTFSYTGLVNGDTKVNVEPTISTTAMTSSPAGDYPINLTGGSDDNYDIKLVNGVLKITKALLTIKANAQSKIFGTIDPVLTFTATGFKNNDTVSSLNGKLSREPGEAVGIYQITLGTLTSGNYELVFISDKFEILPAVIISVTNPDLIQTPWSVIPTLPTQLSVVTADGQVIQIGVMWDLSTLNVFKRGRYFVTGTLILPAGIQNPQGYQATLEIEVLAKPAPLDITLSNNVFIPDPKNYFQVIGTFTVIDPIDNIHIISLVNGAADNQYFEIKEGVLFWSSADKVAGRTTFTILVRVVDRDGNQIEKSFEIRRERMDINGLEVYNTFTPNGDGINDTWGVPDLRYYTGVRVQVFDRGGERVFYTEDADKRWDGTYKGKEMPVGSYYWNLQVVETGDIRRRGILNLLKQ